MLHKYAIYLVFSLFCVSSIWAQKKIDFVFQDDSYQHIIKHPKTNFKDSIEALEYIREFRASAIKKGHLLASIDSIHYFSDTIQPYFYIGEQLKQIKISIKEKDLQFIRQHSSINEKYLTSLPFSPDELSKSFTSILKTYLNNGYPFAQINLVNISIGKENSKAELNINKGKLYTWSDIHIRGDSSINLKLISNTIGISIGDVFNEKLLNKITNKIQQVSYLQEIKPSEILFKKEGCELFLYLKTIPTSSMNGIIGFQPNPVTERLIITGELNLNLLNTLNRGEQLKINWQSIQEKTQSLKSSFSYPYLFNTSFGVKGKFNLYKRDSTFLDLLGGISVLYYLSQHHYIEGFYNNITNTKLLGADNNPTFSKIGDAKTNLYGLGYTYQQLDYLPNPSRGMNISLSMSSGARNYRLNDTLPYQKSTTYRGELSIEYFVPLAKRHVLRAMNEFNFYSADEIFQNELSRFGGLNSLRGFNEDELYSSTFNVSTLEYRFLLDRNSNVFAFYNLAWYENVAANYYNDKPMGFGLGFSFSTNLGSFAIAYALGKQFNNPILFQDSKIHFGYIAYF